MGLSPARQRDKKIRPEPLSGTTFKVYKFLFKAGGPVGIYDIQRGLELSSPSVAQYHIKKLLEMGLVKEQGEGYTIDKVLFDNVIRIRQMAFPLQAAYAAFFAVILVALGTVARPPELTSAYFIAIVGILTALLISLYEMFKTMGNLR